MTYVRTGIVVSFLLSLLACTALGRATAVKDGLEIALCVAENQNLSDVEIIAKCIRDGISEDDIKKIIADQRVATKRAAERAACAASPDAGH